MAWWKIGVLVYACFGMAFMLRLLYSVIRDELKDARERRGNLLSGKDRDSLAYAAATTAREVQDLIFESDYTLALERIRERAENGHFSTIIEFDEDEYRERAVIRALKRNRFYARQAYPRGIRVEWKPK